MMLEIVHETFGGFVLSSSLRVPTESEIIEARQKHAEGRCDHRLIRDEPNWLYDFRYCAICDRFLGFI